MAWNEPGGSNKDPWGGGGNEGPPDLDEMARKMRERMNKFFGFNAGGSAGRGGGRPFSF
jgi:membrane protease subunit HflK